MKKRKSREQRRNEAAEKVCRELRYQLYKEGQVYDLDRLWLRLMPWFNVAKKNKNVRP